VSIKKDTPVEIMETEEPREPKPTKPERIRNPSIEVVIIPGRWIVSDNGRALIVVIVVNRRWFVILGIVLRRCCGVWLFNFRILTLTFSIRSYREVLLGNEILECLGCLILPHR
jgi:hypothetical protein